MGITAAANSKIGIGAVTIASPVLATFTADTYVNFANIRDAGEAGSEAEVITGKYLDQPYTRKIKGSRDAGSMDVVIARDSSDPGYAAMIAAEKTSNCYNFCVELNDKPATGASPKNSKFYFSALVASAKNRFGEADDVVETTFSLAISGPIYEVAASAT